MRHLAVCAAFGLLAACNPPATDDSANRGGLPAQAAHPSAPLDSPNTVGAVWADSDRPLRLVYGIAGKTPLAALSCERTDAGGSLRITRFAAADPEAKALMALIGNGHAARLPIDAVWNGRGWLWEASFSAHNPELEVLTGPHSVEMTIPGAGSVVLNASQRPARLIEQCRALPGQPDQPD